MRRRGRAQDSTEGPDGPRLGYGPSQGVITAESHLGRLRNYALVPCDPAWFTVDKAWRRVGDAVYRDAVSSGRERLGE